MKLIRTALNRLIGLESVARRTKKTRLTVERLDERLMPSVTFATYGNGTWAYDHDTDNWRQLATVRATVMDEGADGTLFASYAGQGTWRYDYGADDWQRLTRSEAMELSAANDNTMFASYSGWGTYEYDGSWNRISTVVATELAAVSNDHSFGSYGSRWGTWEWDGGWTQLARAESTEMDASSGGVLYASYDGHGTWRHDGSWSQLTVADTQNIAVVNNNTFYATYATGVYRYENGWYNLSTSVADQISADAWTPFVCSFVSGGDDFGRGLRGTYEHDGRFNQITGVGAELLA